MKSLKKLFPRRWKHAIKQWMFEGLEADIRRVASQVPPDIDLLRQHGVVMQRAILQEVYTPWQRYPSSDPQFLGASPVGTVLPGQRLPLPPDEVLMGYHGDTEQYLREGRQTAELIREVLGRHGAPLEREATVLDWGCASGRVLRNFEQEARHGAFWGVDQHARCILWAKEYLSPPFHFLTGSALPHLPFPDGTFDLVYGISVFTHLEHLVDAWLMELRRVLKPGGHCFLTVHTEASLETFRNVYWPPWLDAGIDQAALVRHDVSVIPGHGDWGITYVFYREEYVRKEWGRYLEVRDILPAAVPFGQTAVLLRK